MRQALQKTCLPTRHPLSDALDKEYCTVVFRLRGGRPTMSEFLFELSQYVERSGTVEIVRLQVGDSLDHPHS